MPVDLRAASDDELEAEASRRGWVVVREGLFPDPSPTDDDEARRAGIREAVSLARRQWEGVWVGLDPNLLQREELDGITRELAAQCGGREAALLWLATARPLADSDEMGDSPLRAIAAGRFSEVREAIVKTFYSKPPYSPDES